MQPTRNQVLREITLDYLGSLNSAALPTPEEMEGELLERVANRIELENAVRGKGQKWQIPGTLSFSQIADLMAYLYPICRISCAGKNADSDYDLLAIYQTEGPDEGIYVTSEDTFRRLARRFNYSLSAREFDEVMLALRDKVPQRSRCEDPDLIAVNNGIFDYRTKALLPFDPAHVFIAKSGVNYSQNPANPVIHNPDDNTDWDVETWMAELSDDPEIVNVLWEILGAIVRPNVRWNKSAWLYSETGNNGKGTLCELMRCLCGDRSYASIPIADFSKDFLLEPLTRASAIIVDENDVGLFIDKAANLKAVITNDVIQINRKFKTPIAYQFFGFMVQCLNEMPRIKDKSDSFYRRQLFIPMEKCFTGKERRYIKSTYLHRPDVLEYVLHRVLNMNYYTLSEPDACRIALDQYKEFNDPIRQFADELLPECRWDCLPFTFLYDLYKSWFRKNSPSGTIQGKTTFINDILNVVAFSPDWYSPGKGVLFRTKNMMDASEPLILQYGLDDWKHPIYRGNDPQQICAPPPPARCRGIIRRTIDLDDQD